VFVCVGHTQSFIMCIVYSVEDFDVMEGTSCGLIVLSSDVGLLTQRSADRNSVHGICNGRGTFAWRCVFYIINMIFSVYSSPYNRNEMLKGKPLASRLGRRACQATGAPSPAYEAPAKQ
jgi:hypothetical protein